MRSASHYLLASNGIVGTKGFGNHKHNDQLSFEYHAAGVPLIVDPGSFVYTSDFDARNLFRSTASHNTLQIDGFSLRDILKSIFQRPSKNRLRNDMSYMASRSRISQKLNGFLVITKFMLSSRNLVSPNHTTMESFAQRIAERLASLGEGRVLLCSEGRGAVALRLTCDFDHWSSPHGLVVRGGRGGSSCRERTQGV